MSKTVIIKKKGAIARVAFNRPNDMNTLNAHLPLDLYQALESVRDDADIRVIILEGEGPCFMAGGDISYFKRQIINAENQGSQVIEPEFFKQVHGAITLMQTMSKPIIAQVHGAVAGIGISYMAACDLAIAASNTTFTLAYRNIGLTPDGGSTWLLPRMIGLKKTMELALLGERFDAESACQWGLVNRVVAPETLSQNVTQLAEKLAAGPTLVQAKTKALVNSSFEHSLSQQLDIEASEFVVSCHRQEFREGIYAFSEKRKPDWNN